MAHTQRLDATLRRRNRRWALLFTLIAFAGVASAPLFVRHHMIYPEHVTYAFPHWLSHK